MLPAEQITHSVIDARLLRLVQACVEKIDRDPTLLERVAENISKHPNATVRAFLKREFDGSWPALRALLLEDSERGAQLRQDAPLTGILTDAERAAFFAP